MSGAELIGIISGVIAIVDASRKIYEAVEDASGLPQSFRDVDARLPAVQETLETTRETLKEEEGGEQLGISRIQSRDAMAKILKSCYDKAVALNKTLQAAMPTQGASKAKRYIKAIKIFSTANEVDTLMKGILADIQVLAANHSVKSATKTQIKDLFDIIRRKEKQESIYRGRRATVSLYNAGKGSQFVFDGKGNQNISMGQGMQLNGSSTAPIYISMTS
ncbi:hypothetical protein V8C42DRAFT_341465 [Trichoderma barbatum]